MIRDDLSAWCGPLLNCWFVYAFVKCINWSNRLSGGGNVLDSLHWIRQTNLEVFSSLFLDYSFIIKIAVSFL